MGGPATKRSGWEPIGIEQDFMPALEDLFGAAEVDGGRRQLSDAGVVMLVVVPGEKATRFLGGELLGFAGAPVKVVTGTGRAILHPVDTARGLAHLALHPILAAKALTKEFVDSSVESQGEAAGDVLFNVFLGTAGRAASVADLGRTATAARVDAALVQSRIARAAPGSPSMQKPIAAFNKQQPLRWRLRNQRLAARRHVSWRMQIMMRRLRML